MDMRCRKSLPPDERERRRPMNFANGHGRQKVRRHVQHHPQKRGRSIHPHPHRRAPSSRSSEPYRDASSRGRESSSALRDVGCAPSLTATRKAEGGAREFPKRERRKKDCSSDEDSDDINAWSHLQRTRRSERQFIQSKVSRPRNGAKGGARDSSKKERRKKDCSSSDEDSDDVNAWSHLQRTRRSERQFIQSNRISTNNLPRMRDLFFEKDTLYGERRQISIDSSDDNTDDAGDDSSDTNTDSSSDRNSDNRSIFAPKNGSAKLKLTCPPILKRRLKPKKVHDSPHIYVLDDFLTSTEVDHLQKKIRRAENKELFQKSFVDNSDDSSDDDRDDNDDDNGRKKSKEDEEQKKQRRKKTQCRQRTSTFIHFAKMADSKIASIENRAADILGLANHCIEPLQLVRYLPGQHFGTHHDLGVYNEENETVILPKRSSLCPPRRIATIFVYLNDIPQTTPVDGGRGGSLSCRGGCTFFPNANSLEIQPKRGRAVLWSNIDRDGNPDCRTIHSGLPMTTSHKPPDLSTNAGRPSKIQNSRKLFNPVYQDVETRSDSNYDSVTSDSDRDINLRVLPSAASDFPLNMKKSLSNSVPPMPNVPSAHLEMSSVKISRPETSGDSHPLHATEPERETSQEWSLNIPRKKTLSETEMTHNSAEVISRVPRKLFDTETAGGMINGEWSTNKRQTAISPHRLPLKKRKFVIAAPTEMLKEEDSLFTTPHTSPMKEERTRRTNETSLEKTYSAKGKVSNGVNSESAVTMNALREVASSVGTSHSSSESDGGSSDSDDEEWGFLRDLRQHNGEPARRCMIKGCKNKAVALWATTGTVQKTYYYCESCQETDFGGWPGPEDYHHNSEDRPVESESEGMQKGGFDVSEFLRSRLNGGCPPIVKYGINIWACEE